MTKQEYIQDICDRCEHSDPCQCAFAYLGRLCPMLKDVSAAIDWARKNAASKWVSVEDELPPYEEGVLVCNENDPEYMWFCHRSQSKKVKTAEYAFCNYTGIQITHWMRIPVLNTKD